jgi:hypothetical protein
MHVKMILSGDRIMSIDRGVKLMELFFGNPKGRSLTSPLALALSRRAQYACT